ncbi:MAG: RNA polymerase sporulation sigma factor SigH [Clostridiales bacterium]|nr:RNA polymerase sporulation sigma factor SigH [Clostridiales bacterium]
MMENLHDETLIEQLRQGDEDAERALYERYKPVVRARARTYFLVGADHEDLMQEGMIGLYKAVCEYDKDKAASFHSFADLCITRQILTAIKSATRKKHAPLNTYVSLNQPVFEQDNERTLLDLLANVRVCDPEELLIGKESYEAAARYVSQHLSALEKQAFSLYLQGHSYPSIAELLSRPPKSVDNAIQRAKKKLERFSFS